MSTIVPGYESEGDGLVFSAKKEKNNDDVSKNYQGARPPVEEKEKVGFDEL